MEDNVLATDSKYSFYGSNQQRAFTWFLVFHAATGKEDESCAITLLHVCNQEDPNVHVSMETVLSLYRLNKRNLIQMIVEKNSNPIRINKE